MNGVIKVRQYAANICDLFEDLLEIHNIDIPDEDREGDEGEPRIYGITYAELEDNVKTILEKILNESSQYDEYEIDSYNY